MLKRVFSFKYLWLIIMVAVLVTVDIVVKSVAAARLTLDKPVTVIPGFFSLRYTENDGASFGILSGMFWLFIVITIVMLTVLTIIYWRSQFKSSKLFSISFGLIFAGAIGNLIDRMFLQYVRDYFWIHFFPAIFNLADVFITFGTAMLMIFIVRCAILDYKKKKQEKCCEPVTGQTTEVEEIKEKQEENKEAGTEKDDPKPRRKKTDSN